MFARKVISHTKIMMSGSPDLNNTLALPIEPHGALVGLVGLGGAE